MPYKDKNKQKEFQHNHYLKNRTKYQNRSNEWKRKNRIKINEYVQNLRKKILELLGNKCVYCGCDIPEALEINHIKGGGNQEKHYRRARTMYYLDILKGRRDIKELELTCRVCNSVHYLEKLKKLGKHWEVTYLP
jgi:hypothetical protein